MALELLESDLRVAVVEGGGRSADTSRNPYRVVPGRHARATLGTDPSKGWGFGGSTNIWAGNCRPLENIDLEAREWVPNSGWPLGQDDLLPYYERAQVVLGLGDFRWYDAEACGPHLAHGPLDVDPSILTPLMVQTCPVLSLAELYGGRLGEAENVHVLASAEALRLCPDSSNGRISTVEVGTAAGVKHIRAETFVLACGGIENPRLLLASTDNDPSGIGNDHDLVGRYFTEHWWFDIPVGDWDAFDLALHRFQPGALQEIEGASLWAQLGLADDLVRRERIPGLAFYFVPTDRASAGLSAARTIALSLLRRESFDPAADLRLFFSDPRLARKRPRERERGQHGARTGVALRVEIEQVPDPENRIVLDARDDAFGSARPELTLRLTPQEREGHERGLELAASEFGLDVSRSMKQMRLKLDGRRYGFFWHHMGTTRMDGDPSRGVVDLNCRVHGMSNLFIAGSSVFPTGGCAPPTLAIVALALRIADEIVGSRVCVD